MKKVLIGISGSIAAYKTVLLIRQLNLNGYQCKVVLTKGGSRFVTPELIAGLGCEVFNDELLQLTVPSQAMQHIKLAKWADLILLAPASANSLARLAHGMTSDLFSEIILVAGEKPRYIAPAMNYQMWKNSITQANIKILRQHGFIICPPQHGVQACGDVGEGRMLEVEQLIEIIHQHFNSRPILNNKTILITLGATMEPIDPVRFISNHSSGKMGVALINAALAFGANVIALAAKTSISLPNHPNLTIINTLTAKEMLAEALHAATNANILIGCAAVCDYRLATTATQKIKKDEQNLTLALVPNPDIITECKTQFPKLFCVGFAAETENLIKNARQKLLRKNLDLIIANSVSEGKVFNQDTNHAFIISSQAVEEQAEQTKTKLAETIMQKIAEITV